MIILCATVFALTFRLLGGEHLVTDYIKHLGLSPWHLLIIVMGLVFFLGFFFEWIEITLIVLPVFAPILLSLDFGDHVPKADVAYWFAILLAVNLQTSFLTPPMGPSLFYMKAVSPPGVRMQDIYWGIIPFVLLQIIGLGLVMAFPQIALWMPHMLLDK
jgi:TRAP-type mannitol/chloroaromatic compound transport system permease large subunit